MSNENGHSHAPIDGSDSTAAPAEAEVTQPDALELAFADAEARLGDPALTPAGFLTARVQALKSLGARVHPARRGEAVRLVGTWVTAAIAIQQRWVREMFASLPDIGRQLITLRELPPPEPSLERHGRMRMLLEHGWSGGEIDLLRPLFEPGEDIVGVTDQEVTLRGSGNTRTFTRRQLRDNARPQTWTNSESWEHQFPKIPGESRPADRV